jgi:hypothetical protein
MAKIGKKPTDDQLLEGGGSGAGGASVKGTKWSKMPSFKGNASFMDDVKKLTKDTSHLKGGAKKSTDLAEERAAARMGVRAAGAGTVAGIAKGLSGSGADAKEDTSKSVKERPAEGTPTPTPTPQKKTYNPNMSVKGKLYEGRNPEIDDDTREAAGGYKRGGKVSSASSRADGCATKGKTKGRMV